MSALNIKGALAGLPRAGAGAPAPEAAAFSRHNLSMCTVLRNQALELEKVEVLLLKCECALPSCPLACREFPGQEGSPAAQQ